MLINRANLSVRHAASNDPDRAARMSVVLVEPDGTTVATDAHMLARVSPCPLEDADFPVLPNTMPLSEPKQVFFSLEMAKGILKALPKRSVVPALETAQIGLSSSGDVIASVTDLQRVQTFATEKDFAFPNYQAVFPKGKPVKIDGIGFNVLLLANVLAIVKDFKDAKADPGLKWTFYGAGEPVLLETENGEGQTLTMLLMPYKVE